MRRARRSRTDQFLGELGGEQRVEQDAGEIPLAVDAGDFGEGAIAKDDAARGVERDDAGGDGLEDGLELFAAGLDGEVGGGELARGSLGEQAALLEVGRHVVEGADQLGHLGGGLDGDAMTVVPLADFDGGVGERFEGAGHLPGDVEGEPAAGEEDQSREHEQQQEIRHANDAALAVEGPVLAGAGGEVRHDGVEAGGHGKTRHQLAAIGQAGHAEGELGATHHQHRFVGSVRGFQDCAGKGLAGGNALAVVVVVIEPGAELGGPCLLRKLVGGHRGTVGVENRESALEGDLVLRACR